MASNVIKGTNQKLGIALNDRLIIRNKRYIINNFTTDLTTGEANFELITDYRGVDAASSVGYRFATNSDVKTDRGALVFNNTIYLNDNDGVAILSSDNFLTFESTTYYHTEDINLEITVPYNGTGVDRFGTVMIEYIKDGVISNEIIIVEQTAI
jgi:hypothetical protein